MPTITSVEVYGKNGDPCDQSGSAMQKTIRRATRDADRCIANQRFGALQPNSARVEGEGFDTITDLRAFRLESGMLPQYRFAILEVDVINPNLAIIYFVAFLDDIRKGTIQPRDVGDLTVVIDTATPPPSESSGSDGDVDIEDAP